MIKMLVAKQNGELILGKVSKEDSDLIDLEDVVQINIIQTQQGISPLPGYYPSYILKDFIRQTVLNSLSHEFVKKDYIIFNEEDVKDEVITIYRKEMAQRSGIVLTTTMPNLNG